MKPNDEPHEDREQRLGHGWSPHDDGRGAAGSGHDAGLPGDIMHDDTSARLSLEVTPSEGRGGYQRLIQNDALEEGAVDFAPMPHHEGCSIEDVLRAELEQIYKSEARAIELEVPNEMLAPRSAFKPETDPDGRG